MTFYDLFVPSGTLIANFLNFCLDIRDQKD
jgi:hypothetical protein